MAVRGIRGATVAKANTVDDILRSTTELLTELIQQNAIDIDEVASIFFSVTTDLTAVFPAVAARQMGFFHTPLFCLTEIPVPDSLTQCIRILIHLNTDKQQVDMHHVYLNDAEVLRPDWTDG